MDFLVRTMMAWRIIWWFTSTLTINCVISIVAGLWNHVFLFSNLSLFVFLPFAYLFSESSGFPGYRGLRGRVYETFIVLALLGVAMLGLAYVISAWLEGARSSIDALLSECLLLTNLFYVAYREGLFLVRKINNQSPKKYKAHPVAYCCVKKSN